MGGNWSHGGGGGGGEAFGNSCENSMRTSTEFCGNGMRIEYIYLI